MCILPLAGGRPAGLPGGLLTQQCFPLPTGGTNTSQWLCAFPLSQVDDLLAYQEGRAREAELGAQLESIGGAQDNVRMCWEGARAVWACMARQHACWGSP